jgi:hypothetical protein
MMALAIRFIGQVGVFLAILHSLTPTSGLFQTAFSPLFALPITFARLPSGPAARSQFAHGTAIPAKGMVRIKEIFTPF